MIIYNSVDEYILCAAIWFKDDKFHEHQPVNIKSGIVVCGRRHHNCYITAFDLNDGKCVEGLHESNAKAIQGFLTNKDRFIDRKEAAEIAIKAHQTERETDCLFSEDLY